MVPSVDVQERAVQELSNWIYLLLACLLAHEIARDLLEVLARGRVPGRGPRDISPFSTLKNWGSSSRLNLRIKLPKWFYYSLGKIDFLEVTALSKVGLEESL